jgi:excisionase family DNA binding protein
MKMQTTTPAERLSLLESGPVLGVSPHTIRAWARRGLLPYHKLGRRLVFDRGDLERFLAANRVEARSERRGR